VLGPPKFAQDSSSGGQGSVKQGVTIGGGQRVTATVNVQIYPETCDPGEIVGCENTASIIGKSTWYVNTSEQVTLSPANYTLEANAATSNGDVYISISWREWVPTKAKVGGGVRVREIRSGDGYGNEQVRKYSYRRRSDTARSSGVITREPAYMYTRSTSNCAYVSRSTSSRLPLGSASTVAYREVTVTHGSNGEFGKTRETFRAADIENDDELDSNTWPFLRVTSPTWKRGHRIETNEYNSAGQIQRRERSVHAFGTADSTAKTFRGLSLHSLLNTENTDYFWNAFEVGSIWFHVSADSIRTYNETGSTSFTSVRSYAYNS